MKKLVLFSISVLLLASCASMATGPSATATMISTSGSTATGTVNLAQLGDGSVEVTATFRGVPPGVHGFHIHEKGDCGDNGNAAGGHYNPAGTPRRFAVTWTLPLPSWARLTVPVAVEPDVEIRVAVAEGPVAIEAQEARRSREIENSTSFFMKYSLSR